MRIAIVSLILFAACRPSNKIGELVGVPIERPLEKTFWVLIELEGKPIATSNESKKISLLLNQATQTASGFAGCNQFSGSYTLAGKKLNIKDIASTRMFCQETMQLEIRFLQILREVDAFQINQNELLLSKTHQLVARFQADVKNVN